MRFLFEEGEEVKEQYKTAISDARWIAYDIPGNAGWIAYLVCVFLGLREKKDSYNIASALPVFHFAISSNVSPVIRYVVHSSMGTAPRDR